MPWWAKGLLLALGAWLLTEFILKPKLGPLAKRKQERADKLKRDKEEALNQARQDREVRWQNDVRALRNIKRFLDPLSVIYKFQDTYTPQACYKLLSAIQRGAEQISSPEILPFREKLLKYADKKERMVSSLEPDEKISIILGKYDRLNPQDLINEINTLAERPPK